MICLSIPILPSKPIIKEDKSKIYSMRECEMVHQTLISKFLVLSDNKTGVVVITTETLPDFIDEIFELEHGFNTLEDRGIQKVSTL